jgi:hypothetical protein
MWLRKQNSLADLFTREELEFLQFCVQTPRIQFSPIMDFPPALHEKVHGQILEALRLKRSQEAPRVDINQLLPVKERYHSENPMVEEALESACKCGHLGGPCTDGPCASRAEPAAYYPDPTEATYIDCSGSMQMDDDKMALLRLHTVGDEFFFTHELSAKILQPGGGDLRKVFEHAIANRYKYIRIVTDQGGFEDGTKIVKNRADRLDYVPFKIDWRVILEPR